MRLSTMKDSMSGWRYRNRRRSSVLERVGFAMSVEFEAKSELPDVFVRPIPL